MISILWFLSSTNSLSWIQVYVSNCQYLFGGFQPCHVLLISSSFNYGKYHSFSDTISEVAPHCWSFYYLNRQVAHLDTLHSNHCCCWTLYFCFDWVYDRTRYSYCVSFQCSSNHQLPLSGWPILMDAFYLSFLWVNVYLFHLETFCFVFFSVETWLKPNSWIVNTWRKTWIYIFNRIDSFWWESSPALAIANLEKIYWFRRNSYRAMMTVRFIVSWIFYNLQMLIYFFYVWILCFLNLVLGFLWIWDLSLNMMPLFTCSSTTMCPCPLFYNNRCPSWI